MVKLATLDQTDKNDINQLRSKYIILMQDLLEFLSHCENLQPTECSFYRYQLALSNLSILSNDNAVLMQQSRNALFHLSELVKILHNCKESQRLFQFAVDVEGKFSVGSFVEKINQDIFIQKFRCATSKQT